MDAEPLLWLCLFGGWEREARWTNWFIYKLRYQCLEFCSHLLNSCEIGIYTIWVFGIVTLDTFIFSSGVPSQDFIDLKMSFWFICMFFTLNLWFNRVSGIRLWGFCHSNIVLICFLDNFTPSTSNKLMILVVSFHDQISLYELPFT